MAFNGAGRGARAPLRHSLATPPTHDVTNEYHALSKETNLLETHELFPERTNETSCHFDQTSIKDPLLERRYDTSLSLTFPLPYYEISLILLS